MAKWDYLIEGERDYRDAMRAWQSQESEETANAFIRAAERARKTNTPDYYAALWFVGRRPDQSKIYAASMMVSEAVDALWRDLMVHQGMRFPVTQTYIRLALKPNNEPAGLRAQNKYDAFSSRGIQQSNTVSREELIALSDMAMTISENIRDLLVKGKWKITPRVANNIDSIRRAAERMRVIAGGRAHG